MIYWVSYFYLRQKSDVMYWFKLLTVIKWLYFYLHNIVLIIAIIFDVITLLLVMFCYKGFSVACLGYIKYLRINIFKFIFRKCGVKIVQWEWNQAISLCLDTFIDLCFNAWEYCFCLKCAYDFLMFSRKNRFRNFSLTCDPPPLHSYLFGILF